MRETSLLNKTIKWVINIAKKYPFYFTFLLLTFWILIGNTIETLLSLKSLQLYTGQIETLERTYFKCRGSRYRVSYCEKTIIKLNNSKIRFKALDDPDRGAYIDGLNVGDKVDVYSRRWFQYPLTFGSRRDIYHLVKSGTIYYSSDYKTRNLVRIIISGFLLIFILIFFLLELRTERQYKLGKFK